MADSPDPLASSLRGVVTPVRTTRSSAKKIVSGSGRMAGTESRQRSLESPYKESHIITRSPSKYPGARGESPWRIRVTVEAEPEESHTQSSSPQKMAKDPTDSLAESFDSPLSRGRTTTTTVPLKGLDSSASPTKKSRGRPRKSGTPTRRTSTPAPKRRQSVVKSPGTAVAPPILDRSEDPFVVPVTRATRRGRRKELSPVHVATDSETDYNDGVGWHEAAGRHSRLESALRDVQINKVLTPEPGMNNLADKSIVSRNESLDRRSQKTSEISSSSNDILPKKADSQFEFLAPPPKKAGFKEFDSVLESEEFSMISTASLPSVKEHLNSPHIPPAQATPAENSTKDNGVVKSPEGSLPPDDPRTKNIHTNTWLNAECSSMINPPDQSTDVRSSPPARVLGYHQSSMSSHDVTPAGNTSPDLPPPLQANPKSGPNQAHPRPAISPVVRAGRSLQSAVSRVGSVLGSPFSSPVKSRISDDQAFSPFSGFSQKTRRELGAGLRLGESIAGTNDGSSPLNADQDDVFLSAKRPSNIRYPSLSKAILQLPSPAKSQDDGDAMDWTEHSIAKRHTLEPGSKVSVKAYDERDQSAGHHSTLEDREIEWQRERARVSQSINQASLEEVIVIESSEADFEPDTRHSTINGVAELISTHPSQPARGKIPSPWRRGRVASMVYSDEIPPPSSPSKALSTIDELAIPSEASPSRPTARKGFPVEPTPLAPPSELLPPACISSKMASTSWQSNHYAALNYLWRHDGKWTSPLLPFRHTLMPLEPITDSGSLYHTVSSTDGSILGCRVTDRRDEMEVSAVEAALLGAFRSLCEGGAACWDDWYILGQLFAIVVDARNKRVERHLRRVPADQDVSGFLGLEHGKATDQPLPDGEGNCTLM